MKTIQRVLFVGLLLIVGLMALYAPSVSAAPTQVYPGDNVQAKIDATPAGGTVLVNQGVYHQSVVISKSLTLLSDRAVLDGSEPADTGTTLGHHAIDVAEGTTNVVIDGFEIRNYNQGGFRTNAGTGILAYYATSYVTIRNNNMHDNRADIWAYNYGDEDAPHHNHWTIVNNNINDIFCTNLSYGVISGNAVTLTEVTDIGIRIEAFIRYASPTADPLTVTDINITNNTIRGGGGAAFDFAGGITLDATSRHGEKVYLQNVRVTGNEISDLASNGIYVSSFVGDPDTHPGGIAEVRSLTIQNNDIVRNAACGTKMEGVIQSSLQGNTIKSNGEAGIQLNSVTACNINSNVVNRNLDGISLAASSGNTIQNNTTSRNGRYGISLADLSHNNLVRLNQALNNTTFDLVQDATCTGNVWKNNNFGTKSGF